MRRSIFILLLASSCTALFAQEDSPGMRVALTVSPNYASIHPDGDGIQSNGSKFGMGFGLLADIPLSGNGVLAARTGLAFVSVGGKIEADEFATSNGTASTTQDMALHYLEVPLCLKVSTRSAKRTNVYALLGGSLGFLIYARTDAVITTTINGFSTIESNDGVDIMDDVASINFALVGGVGMAYSLGADDPTLFAGVTYHNGLTNLPDKNAEFLVSLNKMPKLFSNYVELSLGVFF